MRGMTSAPIVSSPSAAASTISRATRPATLPGASRSGHHIDLPDYPQMRGCVTHALCRVASAGFLYARLWRDRGFGPTWTLPSTTPPTPRSTFGANWRNACPAFHHGQRRGVHSPPSCGLGADDYWSNNSSEATFQALPGSPSFTVEGATPASTFAASVGWRRNGLQPLVFGRRVLRRRVCRRVDVRRQGQGALYVVN